MIDREGFYSIPIKVWEIDYPKIQSERYKERLTDLWKMFYKMRKFKMHTTGNFKLDLEIISVCGARWDVEPEYKFKMLFANGHSRDEVLMEKTYQDWTDPLTVWKYVKDELWTGPKIKALKGFVNIIYYYDPQGKLKTIILK